MSAADDKDDDGIDLTKSPSSSLSMLTASDGRRNHRRRNALSSMSCVWSTTTGGEFFKSENNFSASRMASFMLIPGLSDRGYFISPVAYDILPSHRRPGKPRAINLLCTHSPLSFLKW
eukprot:CAMPEP_0167780614 /NCGR_PEP_ID=MMETSP0111_2-20121227/5463_1 /TAXON_ID=91324 /ORGANISM="Lotharella globosa, Strain CCCM811" /LENGTH=117 /DNA_ID=CAMNT_0007671161 /DNA_START=126 /DNA_END=476 /DNA_ORIENTATION=+